MKILISIALCLALMSCGGEEDVQQGTQPILGQAVLYSSSMNATYGVWPARVPVHFDSQVQIFGALNPGTMYTYQRTDTHNGLTCFVGMNNAIGVPPAGLTGVPSGSQNFWTSVASPSSRCQIGGFGGPIFTVPAGGLTVWMTPYSGVGYLAAWDVFNMTFLTGRSPLIQLSASP
jgi:hypothetical protein